MKIIFALSILFLFPYFSNAQDTLFVKKKANIICKIVEIGIDEIKFKAWDNLEGPVIVVLKSDVYKIAYQNGKSEFVEADKLDINKEAEILDKKSVIKFGMFSLLNNHFSVGYERVLSVGKNLEVKIAYIGVGVNPFDFNISGTYTKIGVKFLLGNDYYVKGMKYIHPLKGRYIKPEFIYTYIFENDLTIQYYSGIYPYNQYQTINYDVNTSAFAFNIVYGRQFILGNVMTIDYSFGVGYGFISSKSTSSNMPSNWQDYSTNCYSHLCMGEKFPLTLSAGLNIGFILK